MADTKMTPMLRQYRQLKRRHPDALLFYRLGDFYELFEEDARTTARELGLVLTSRRFSKKVRLPMCGVPYRTVTGYIARLLQAGHKVAIAEQLEEARRTKGLVKRDVVRIITPGTVVEEDLLPEKGQSLLVAVVAGQKEIGKLGNWEADSLIPQFPNSFTFGLAAVDLSTGEFAATQGCGWPALAEELQRLRPSEIVLPARLAEDEAWRRRLQAEVWEGAQPVRLSSVPDAETAPGAVRERLAAHFGSATAAEGGGGGRPLALAAAGAALFYLQDSQISDLAHLRALNTYELTDYVRLDATTRRNLELTATLREGRAEGSLLSVLDSTETAMGARLLRRWIHQPLLGVASIRARLDAVEELVAAPVTGGGEEAEEREAFLRGDLRKLLDGIYDMERLVGRVGFGSANARDLAALRRSLRRIPRVKALLSKAGAQRLRVLDGQLDELADVAELIGSALVDSPPILLREGGIFRQGYRADLDELRRTAVEGRDWLAAFEATERERLDIPNLRIKYNQVLGFFIEVTRSHLGKVQAEYERRATVRSAERFVTPELKACEAEILGAQDRANDLEYDLFLDLRRRVAAESGRLLAAARVLAELDVLACLAEAAARHGYVRPVMDDGGASRRIEIEGGRHPVVERSLPAGEPFVPNSVRLDADERLLIITGPNMAGKSVLVRQVALIVLMAQMGSFVPAQSAHIALADRIFTRIGASDDIAHGRSTFLVEMGETAHILAQATDRSLVILDEVGRGTSTYDGMSLAWAVAADLHDRLGARTLFATHYHELTALPEHLSASRNYNLAVVEREGKVIFLRRLVPGGADKSYGLHVARLAGVPDEVVAHAERVMARFQKAGDEPEARSTSAPGRDRAWPDPEPEPQEAEGERVLSEEGRGQTYLPATEVEPTRQVIDELCRLDIANLTPVQALVTLNEWQGRLRASQQMPAYSEPEDRTGGSKEE